MNKHYWRQNLLFSILFLLLIGTETTIFAQISQSNRNESFLNIGQDEARKFDEYGKISVEDENARLNSFTLEMRNNAMIRGFIISYGGRRSAADETLLMANRAKDYVLKTGKFDISRIVSVNGGYREEATTELWIVPNGANPPMVSPTVDPSEVVPAKVVKKSKTALLKKKKSTKRKA